jgi:chorismate mutase/prephenate dehydratase
MNLDELRKKVDALDDELVRLLNERTKIALEIGKLKDADAGEVFVPARERAVLDRLRERNEGPLSAGSVEAIYREIMSAALSLQRKTVVAYLGPQATFTHQAARSRFGGSVGYVPAETIGDVFEAVEKKAADYGVVPIENSTDGAVTHTLDEFTDTRLKICAEIYLPISHHVMAAVPREKIRRLYSKPEVFGQSRRWLHENMQGVDLVSVSSTARGAEMAAGEQDSGAIASALAAELYGLNILAEDIQDMGGNTTRFLVIGRNYGPPTGRDKTSIFFAVKHRVGALYDSLSTFKKYNINMSKIESRPSKAKAWEYYFFVDVEGHANEPQVKKALEEMSEHCTLMTILGAYPRAQDQDA